MEDVRLISIIGAGSPSKPAYADAEEVGRLLAAEGYGVVTGGLGGVMEAACKGCYEAGGFSLGILPVLDRSMANPYCNLVIPTGLGQARNLMVVLTGLGAIAISGGAGTLSEIGHALKAGRPVVSLGSWNIENLYQAANPADAVDALLAKLP